MFHGDITKANFSRRHYESEYFAETFGMPVLRFAFAEFKKISFHYKGVEWLLNSRKSHPGFMKQSIDRRTFIRNTGLASLGAMAAPGLLMPTACRPSQDAVIEQVGLYLIHVDAPRHLSHTTWRNRQHVFIRLKAGGISGWAEVLARTNDLDFDAGQWGGYIREIMGMTVFDALNHVKSQYGNWSSSQTEPIEIALYDIWGQLEGKPAVELLGFTGNDVVPGIFTILEEDPAIALEKLHIARAENLTQYIKIKLFGDPDLDLSLVKTMRNAIDRTTFLLGDPNGAYGYLNLEETGDVCIRLRDAGLDGTEDLWREMAPEKWISLQKRVSPLVLIPDYPLRPSWSSFHTLKPGMGKMYNFHPKVLGSLIYAARLARRVKYEWGADIMIGDDSHIGAGAAIWQQIACAIEARCVEALEKPVESDLFLQCIDEKVTGISKNGEVFVEDFKPGWGLKVDENKLRETAHQTVML